MLLFGVNGEVLENEHVEEFSEEIQEQEEEQGHQIKEEVGLPEDVAEVLMQPHQVDDLHEALLELVALLARHF